MSCRVESLCLATHTVSRWSKDCHVAQHCNFVIAISQPPLHSQPQHCGCNIVSVQINHTPQNAALQQVAFLAGKDVTTCSHGHNTTSPTKLSCSPLQAPIITIITITPGCSPPPLSYSRRSSVGKVRSLSLVSTQKEFLGQLKVVRKRLNRISSV